MPVKKINSPFLTGYSTSSTETTSQDPLPEPLMDMLNRIYQEASSFLWEPK